MFIYLISQHRGMAERQNQRAQQARDEIRQVVGFSVADELEKLEKLKNSNTISNEEYLRLRPGGAVTETGSWSASSDYRWTVDWGTGHSFETAGSCCVAGRSRSGEGARSSPTALRKGTPMHHSRSRGEYQT